MNELCRFPKQPGLPKQLFAQLPRSHRARQYCGSHLSGERGGAFSSTRLVTQRNGQELQCTGRTRKSFGTTVGSINCISGHLGREASRKCCTTEHPGPRTAGRRQLPGSRPLGSASEGHLRKGRRRRSPLVCRYLERFGANVLPHGQLCRNHPARAQSSDLLPAIHDKKRLVCRYARRPVRLRVQRRKLWRSHPLGHGSTEHRRSTAWKSTSETHLHIEQPSRFPRFGGRLRNSHPIRHRSAGKAKERIRGRISGERHILEQPG